MEPTLITPALGRTPRPPRPGLGKSPAAALTCLATPAPCYQSPEAPLRHRPFPTFRARGWSMPDLNTGRQKHAVPWTDVTVARFLTMSHEPLPSVMLEDPFHFHLGLLVLGFLKTKGSGQMSRLDDPVWASSGQARTAVPASSPDSPPIGFPFHPNPKGCFSQ